MAANCRYRDPRRRKTEPTNLLEVGDFRKTNGHAFWGIRPKKMGGRMDYPVGFNSQSNSGAWPGGRKSRERTHGAGGARTGLREGRRGYRGRKDGTDPRNREVAA
jgi:hypothetical protein